MSGIKINNLSKTYFLHGKLISALNNINLTINEGSFVTIVGQSGCGKTTLLRLLCDLEKHSSGNMSFTNNGKIVSRKDIKISIVFQEPRLMPWLTVEQNISFSLHNYNNKRLAKEKVDSCLRMLGLESFRNAYPSQISGGMSQRTALGRTICFDPDIILMDEPFGALDAFTRYNLQQELVEIFKTNRKTILFVTHDVTEAVLLGQRVLVFDKGSLSADFEINLGYSRNPLSSDFQKIRNSILDDIFRCSLSSSTMNQIIKEKDYD